MREQYPGAAPVVVGICTYKRVDKLTSLLQLLRGQLRQCSEWAIRILVVDNDKNESARPIVNRFAREFPRCRVDYLNEPSVGVGYARNAIFNSVRPEEVLVFFDDDQEPSPGWLLALLSAHRSSPDEVLVGPVDPILPEFVPDWAQDPRAWGNRHLPDGSTRKHAGFGNILLPRNVLDSGLCRVPTEFLVGPGEDTYITSRLTSAGYVIRQVAAAHAVERVTEERMTIAWLYKRARTSGETWVRVVRATGGSRVRLFASIAKAVGYLFITATRKLYSSDPALKVDFAVLQGRLAGYWSGYSSRLKPNIEELEIGKAKGNGR